MVAAPRHLEVLRAKHPGLDPQRRLVQPPQVAVRPRPPLSHAAAAAVRLHPEREGVGVDGGQRLRVRVPAGRAQGEERRAEHRRRAGRAGADQEPPDGQQRRASGPAAEAQEGLVEQRRGRAVRGGVAEEGANAQQRGRRGLLQGAHGREAEVRARRGAALHPRRARRERAVAPGRLPVDAAPRRLSRPATTPRPPAPPRAFVGAGQRAGRRHPRRGGGRARMRSVRLPCWAFRTESAGAGGLRRRQDSRARRRSPGGLVGPPPPSLPQRAPGDLGGEGCPPPPRTCQRAKSWALPASV